MGDFDFQAVVWGVGKVFLQLIDSKRKGAGEWLLCADKKVGDLFGRYMLSAYFCMSKMIGYIHNITTQISPL